MSQRIVRLNELVRRELSDILHKRYQSEAVAISVNEVRVSPDLRGARVYVSVIGDEDTVSYKMRWLRRMAGAIRGEIGRRIVMKYLPHFEYLLDDSPTRTIRVLQILDELEAEKKPGQAPAG